MRINTGWNKKTNIDKVGFVMKILLSIASIAIAISGFTHILAMNRALMIMFILLALLFAIDGFLSRKQLKTFSYISYGVALLFIIVVVKKWMEGSF